MFFTFITSQFGSGVFVFFGGFVVAVAAGVKSGVPCAGGGAVGAGVTAGVLTGTDDALGAVAFLTFTFRVSFVAFFFPLTVTLTVTLAFPAFLPVTLTAVFPFFFTVAIFLLEVDTASFLTCFAFTFLIVTFLLFPLTIVTDFEESFGAFAFLAASASGAAVPARATVRATAITLAKVLLKFLFKTLTS